jgi:hypothetical protein
VADGSPILLAAVRYLLFSVLCIGLPGLGLQRLARVSPEPALVMPLGLAYCALSYWLSLVAGVPLLFPLLVGAAGALLVLPPRRWRWAPGPDVRGALLPLALLVALFSVTQYRTNRVDSTGEFLLDIGEHADTALHVGVSWELVHGYPPQVPGLAGVTMHYHVGTHLVRAAAARWAGIHPYDAMSRFDITLWAAGLVLALRAVAHVLGLGRATVTAAGFLPLLSDLSFVPGLLLGAHWWAFKLGTSLIEALFYANSMTPALVLALGAIVAVARWEQEGKSGWLALAAALTAGTGFLKVFTGALILFAVVAALLLRRRGRAALAVLVPGAVSLLLLAAGGVSPAGVRGVTVELVPFSPATPARLAFGLPEAQGLARLGSGLVWIVLSLGLRVVGVLPALAALRRGSAAVCALAGLALIGWPLATFLRITADPRADESFYFAQASGLALWLFAAPVVLAAGRHRALWTAAALLLSTPSTIEFVARKAAQPPERIPAAAVDAMRALRAASCPGDVVMTRPLASYDVPLPVVLAGRRVVFSNYIGYWQQFIHPGGLRERDRLVRGFFRSPEPVRALAIARSMDARFVYLTGPQKVDFDPRGALEPLFERGSERVYRILPFDGRGCERRAAAGPR